MEIRPAKPADLDGLYDIDGTIDSSHYLHVDRTGEGLEATWKLNERPLRERRSLPNRLTDESRFLLRQIVTGADEGNVLVAEHDGAPAALLLAQINSTRETIDVRDLRVDFDHRGVGLGSVMMYQVIAMAREQGVRAVATESTTDNVPAARFLAKCGFELSGLDTRRLSNHDLVKESVTLCWHVAFD